MDCETNHPGLGYLFCSSGNDAGCIPADSCTSLEDKCCPTTPSTTTTTTVPNIDCNELCNGVDTGNVGNCCDVSYCDCSSKETNTCPEDQVYCDNYQSCQGLFGETCNDELNWCCSDEVPWTTTTMKTTSNVVSTTSTSTTSDPNFDCNELCGSSDTGNVGSCCDVVYCDCSSKETMTCPEDQVFCDNYQSCESTGGATCNEGLTWCCSSNYHYNNNENNHNQTLTVRWFI